MINKVKDYVHFSRQLVNGGRLKHERWIAELRRSDLLPYLEGNNPLTVLDLANGQLRPQYQILRGQGHHVYGIDMVNHPKRSWQNYAYTIARRLYVKCPQQQYAMPDDTLVCGDVTSLPFHNKSFDAVTSVAAFEHFLDVPTVVREISRILRPGGFIWVLIHLFSSPSGGHNVSLSEIPLRKIPANIDPWDHLRRRRLGFHVPLNEWRQGQYLELFTQHFKILKEYCASREGEEFLTPKLETELSAYSRDELTCGAYVILARQSLEME